VGLGQYGALGMAQAGIGWQQIIHNFYSGVSIGTVPDQTVRVYLTQARGNITPRFGGATIEDVSGAALGSVSQDQTATFSRNGRRQHQRHLGQRQCPQLDLAPGVAIFRGK